MTKKTIFKCAAMLLCAAASFNAHAQVNADDIITTKQNSKSTTALNVVVDNAIEVVLNQSVTSVGFRLASAKDFREDVSQTFNDVITVTSNIPYNISVKTEGDNLANANGKNIPVSAVSMEIVGTGAALGTRPSTKQALNTTGVDLTKKAPETIEQKFSFKVSKSEAASTAFLVPAGLYTTNLFITATQD